MERAAIQKITVMGNLQRTISNFPDSLNVTFGNASAIVFSGKAMKKANVKDFLELFPELQKIWKENIDVGLIKKYMSKYYSTLTDLLEKLTKHLPDAAEQRDVTGEFLYAAMLGLEHTFALMKKQDSPSSLARLKVYTEFLLGITQFTNTTLLPKDHTLLLIGAVKDFLDAALLVLSLDPKASKKTTGIYKNALLLKKALYEVLRLLLVMAIFEEPPSILEAKKSFLLNSLQKILESKPLKKTLEEVNEYDDCWKKQRPGKLVLVCFNRPVLPFYVNEGSGDVVKFSLRYVAVKYNYKIVKIIVIRSKLNHDKYKLNLFLSYLVEGMVDALGDFSGRSTREATALLNESAAIAKTYAFGLASFADRLSPALVKSAYEAIKCLVLKSFKVAIECNLFYQATKEDVNELSLFHPVDLVSLSLKPLLKLNLPASLPRHELNAAQNLSPLLSDLFVALKHVQGEENQWICAIYLLQLMSVWNTAELQTIKCSHYREYVQMLEVSLKNGSVIESLKNKCFDCALNCYINESKEDPKSYIEEIKERMNSSVEYKWIYVLLCLLLGQKESFEDFTCLLKNEESDLYECICSTENSKGVEYFLGEDGLNWVLDLYKTHSEHQLIDSFLLILVLFPQVTKNWLKNYYFNDGFYSLVLPRGKRFLALFFERAFDNVAYQLFTERNVKRYITRVIKLQKYLTSEHSSFKEHCELFFFLTFSLNSIISIDTVTLALI